MRTLPSKRASTSSHKPSHPLCEGLETVSQDHFVFEEQRHGTAATNLCAVKRKVTNACGLRELVLFLDRIMKQSTQVVGSCVLAEVSRQQPSWQVSPRLSPMLVPRWKAWEKSSCPGEPSALTDGRQFNLRCWKRVSFVDLKPGCAACATPHLWCDGAGTPP